MGAVGANLGHTETLSQFPTHFSYDHNAISDYAATTWFTYGLTLETAINSLWESR